MVAQVLLSLLDSLIFVNFIVNYDERFLLYVVLIIFDHSCFWNFYRTTFEKTNKTFSVRFDSLNS